MEQPYRDQAIKAVQSLTSQEVKRLDEDDEVRLKLSKLFPNFIWVCTVFEAKTTRHTVTNFNSKNKICIKREGIDFVIAKVEKSREVGKFQ